MSIHFYTFLCAFAYFLYASVYISWFFKYKIDRLMGGGRLRRPPLINYQFYIKKIKKYTKKAYKKYANAHKNI